MIYPNAPIREALFDIRVNNINIKKVEDLLFLKEMVLDDLPEMRLLHQFTSKINFSLDKPVEGESQSDIAGYVFVSKDKTRQLQIKNDGITLNILKPYENWEKHFTYFIEIWNKYNELFSPNNITRIAARFINRIEIPMPFNSFQEYIVNMPPIPICLPQVFTSFFMQTQIPCNVEGANVNAIISETIEPITNDILPFILDIDVFQVLDAENKNVDLIKNFSEIHILKNDIFENCITDKTRKLFL